MRGNTYAIIDVPTQLHKTAIETPFSGSTSGMYNQVMGPNEN